MTMPRTHKFHYAEGVKSKVFFQGRGRHPIFDCDWSSDVCSSDLKSRGRERFGIEFADRLLGLVRQAGGSDNDAVATATALTAETIARALERWTPPGEGEAELRSEERRVGEEGRSRWSPDH